MLNFQISKLSCHFYLIITSLFDLTFTLLIYFLSLVLCFCLTVDILIIKFLVFSKHVNSLNHSVLLLLSFYLTSIPYQYPVPNFKMSHIFTCIFCLFRSSMCIDPQLCSPPLIVEFWRTISFQYTLN